MHKSKWTDVDDSQKLTALIDEITGVCTVSESAQRVMELTRAGEVNLSSVVDAVMKDPSLAAELIRLANSPLFGQAKQVSDIKRAVVVVGMQELHNIAAAMSMMAAFSAPDPLSLELRNLSVLSAAIARLTARHLGKVEESEAFLAGLLAEIGAMACNAVDTVQYTALWRSAYGDRGARNRYEAARYTTGSEEIGYLVLKRNKLPDEVAAAVRADSESGLLGGITSFARRVAPLIVIAAETSNVEILNRDIPKIAEELNLPPLVPEQWMKICVEAAVTAELSLRGEAMLSEAETEDDAEGEAEPSKKRPDPAAFEMDEIVYAETEARRTHVHSILLNKPESSIRLTGGETSGRRLPERMLFAAFLAAAAGAFYWFFFAS